MIAIEVFDKKITKLESSCYVFPVQKAQKDVLVTGALKEFSQEYYPEMEAVLKASNFTGAYLQTYTLPLYVKKKLINVVLVGLGGDGKKKLDTEQYRRVVGIAYRQIVALKHESAAFVMPSPTLFGVSAEVMGKETAIALNMSSYFFNEFFSDKKEQESTLFDCKLVIDPKNSVAVKKGIKEGECIAAAINKARHWVDLPPSLLTPTDLADKAKDIAKKSDLKMKVFTEEQINKMGMGGLAAVSRGSENDCKLVILEYHTSKKNAPTVAFVGKGITFDSGGLSLKPAASMETMKEDMSGAAAVIAAMQAIAALKPSINVLGITPLAENLPSGKATKPGDIVRFYNGKTAEVKNTDAEGRLILADALSYAVKHYKPDAIIDIATLTGACAYALGPFYTGLMSPDDTLVKRIERAADRSGDAVWRLPFHEDYKKAIRSDVADMSNIGSQRYMAGAITAAWFLHHFVNDTPWAHLDIAGTAFNVPDRPYYRTGATGAGVRLLVDLAMNW